jgi:hypothetical protein
MLSNEKLRNSLLRVRLVRPPQIWTHHQFQPKCERERKRKDEEPFKRAGTIHAARLSQRS